MAKKSALVDSLPSTNRTDGPMYDPSKPYNDLPPLPPPVELETKAVLKRCVAARAALAELRLAGHLIPDQSVLINSIPLLEAKDSSEIENIVTTNDALFREVSLGDGDAAPATKEAAQYRTALYQGYQTLSARPVSTRLAVEICRTVTGKQYDVRQTPSTTLKNSITGEVVYTPPAGAERLRDFLANWERFINEQHELDPLVRMAVQHYQFEAIHPFGDGNGRTGRILNVLCLIQDGLLDLPTLYLSRQILRTRGEYYRLLSRVTSHGEWEPWLLYMLAATEMTSGWTNQKIRAIRALMDATVEYVRASAPKMYSRELVELIFTQPYCRITDLVERGIAERHRASTYLKELVKLGVLVEERQWRDKIFLHRKYLDVLFSDGHTFEPYARTSGLAVPPKRRARVRA
jgi:Fic family protein